MASNPLVTAMFGPGFSQDNEKLIITKADLIPPTGMNPSYEFIPSPSNTSEMLFLALYLRALRHQDQSQDSELTLSPFEMELIYRFGKYQRQYTSVLRVYQNDSVSTFPNPNLI